MNCGEGGGEGKYKQQILAIVFKIKSFARTELGMELLSVLSSGVANMRYLSGIKKEWCDTDRINLLLSYITGRKIEYTKPDLSQTIYTKVYIWQESGCFNILGRYIEYPKIMHYKHMMDNREVLDEVGPGDIIKGFRAHNHVHDIVKEHPEYKNLSVRPYTYQNPKHNNNKWIDDCYCYDLNSAYGYFLKQDMPDTEHPLGKGIVEKGQIGFLDSGNVIVHTDKQSKETSLRSDMMIIEEGGYAEYRFPLIPSRYIKYADNRYSEKIGAKNKQEKANAKKKIIVTVGALQNINPFIRITVVNRANKYILSLKDDNTIYCNTDSIVSKVRREDLEIGTGLGQFKLEHHGAFRYKGVNYEWEDGSNRHSGLTIVTQKFDIGKWEIVNI